MEITLSGVKVKRRILNRLGSGRGFGVASFTTLRSPACLRITHELMIQCMSANATATNAAINAVPPSASAMKIAVRDCDSIARALTESAATIRISAKSDCCITVFAASTVFDGAFEVLLLYALAQIRARFGGG